MDRGSSWNALRALAETQRSVFTVAEAARAGVTRRALSAAARRGIVVRIHRGVYRFAGGPLTWEGEVLAAVKACGPAAAASHETALALRGVRERPAQIEVCSPTLWHPCRPDIWVHQTVALPACDVSSVDGIVATTGARSAIDLAGRFTRSQRLCLVDDLVCGNHTSRRWLWLRSTRLSPGRPNVSEIARVTAPGAEAEFRSWLERRGAQILALHNIPPAAWNARVRDRRGKTWIVDAYWAVVPLIVELEGLRFHTTPEQRQRDAGRFNRLGAVARVLRFTYRDVMDAPERMAADVREALATPAATLLPVG